MPDDKRLVDLNARLNTLRTADQKHKKAENKTEENTNNMRVGLQAGTELITAIIAGGLIGYGLDTWLSTKPIFLIAMLIFGVITGFVNVWRTTQNIGYKVGYIDQNQKMEKDKIDG